MSKQFWCGVFWGLLSLTAGASAYGQDAKVSTANITSDGVNNVVQEQPTFLVRAEVDRESKEYRDGDNLSVKVISEADAHIYVLYQQADGRAFLIFPNSAQKNNRIKAKQPLEIAAGNDLFRWKIAAPYGKEFIKVIATEKPIAALADEKLAMQRFNPITKGQIRGITLELGPEEGPKKPDVKKKPDDPPKTPDNTVPMTTKVNVIKDQQRWAESLLEFTTYPPTHVFEHEKNRRYGVFFGTSKYKFSKFEEETTKHNSDLASAHRDAIDLSQRMSKEGRLTDVQLFTDEKATRANMQSAITQWLPSVSKPGDTVFIYVAGHGAQIPDDDNDEADGLDEILIPHDYFSLSAWLALEDHRKQGRLDPAMAEYHRYGQAVLAECAKKANGNAEQAVAMINQVFCRNTAVSDDLFGHWLQALDGRQVIVILDICHSGGFATNERKLPIGTVRSVSLPFKDKFDFLDGETVRLKDIGQGNTALFSACGAQQTTIERADNGLMTSCLMEAMQKAPGKLTLPDAHSQVSTAMTTYLREANEKRKQLGKPELKMYEPVLYPPSNNSFLLKP